MPAAVIPFSISNRAFVIFTFVIMAVVASLFVISEIVLNWNGWKKRFAVHMRSMQLGELGRRLWTRKNGNPPIPSHSSLRSPMLEPLEELECRLWTQESGSRPIPKRSDSSLSSPLLEPLEELERGLWTQESGSRPIPKRSDSSLPSSLLEPLLDPVGHCTKLRELEEQVVNECRLQKYADSGAVVYMENRAYNLETCMEDFQGLLKAID